MRIHGKQLQDNSVTSTQIETGTPGEISDDQNTEGSADSIARSDHQHAHGTRGGGDLHADATTSEGGFMSAADKTTLDTLAAPATPTQVGQIYYSYDGVTFAAVKPVVSDCGLIITDGDGHIVVVE